MSYEVNLQLQPYTGPIAQNHMVAKLPADVVAKISHDRHALKTMKDVIDRLPNGIARYHHQERNQQQQRQFASAMASYKKLGRFFK